MLSPRGRTRLGRILRSATPGTASRRVLGVVDHQYSPREVGRGWRGGWGVPNRRRDARRGEYWLDQHWTRGPVRPEAWTFVGGDVEASEMPIALLCRTWEHLVEKLESP